jgi:hypothetical protein
LVVDFDGAIGENIDQLRRVEELLTSEIPRPELSFQLKRLAFGSGPTVVQGMPITIDALEKSDFVIERREGEPTIKNRYFSSAPTTTSKHIQILELIERELAT